MGSNNSTRTVMKRPNESLESTPDARKKTRINRSVSSSNTHDASRTNVKDRSLSPAADSISPSLEHVDLAALLDFSSLTSVSSISLRFDQIAETLLHNFRLRLTAPSVESTTQRVISTVTEFDVLELEFYLHKSGCHEDPFTHGSHEQEKAGQWYFHRAPKRSADSYRSQTSSTGYRGGTRKGLDLTIGGPIASPYFEDARSSDCVPLRGGILLRTLRRVSDSKIISGPSLIVDEIMRLSNATSISDLVTYKWNGNISSFPASPGGGSVTTSLRIVRRATLDSRAAKLENPRVYCSPRIGLDLSHPGVLNSPSHPRIVFITKPYRYFIRPDVLTSNGRYQTFIGVYETLMSEGADGPDLRHNLGSLCGLQTSTVAKYLEAYDSDDADLERYIGLAGKGVSASPSKYLTMMGILKRMSTST